MLGWAADYRVVEHIDLPGFDVMYLYDLTAQSGVQYEAPDMGGYEERYLFAWSFGVWAAERMFAGEKFTRAVAFNGTPLPVDAQYGIEPRRLDITIRGLAAGGMEAFERRAYGDEYERLKGVLSPRPLEYNIAELTSLRDASLVPYTPSIAWDKAVVGECDVIFPPANMIRYWQEKAEIETEVLPLPHYPFADVSIVRNEIAANRE